MIIVKYLSLTKIKAKIFIMCWLISYYSHHDFEKNTIYLNYLTVIIQKWTTTTAICQTPYKKELKNLKRIKKNFLKPSKILIVATKRRFRS